MMGCGLVAVLFVALALIGAVTKRHEPAIESEGKPVEQKTAPTNPTSVEKVEVAPPPRVVALNRQPEGFASPWIQCGGVRTRVIGVAVLTPILTNDTRQDFTAPGPALLIWVEAQSLTATGVALRRWQNPLNEFAILTDGKGVRIKAAKFPPGSRVGGQLEGAHSLTPGGPSVIDVLAFEVPADQPLRLELAAAHVAETGAFVHGIPSTAYASK
jgi:hypothetical protein